MKWFLMLIVLVGCAKEKLPQKESLESRWQKVWLLNIDANTKCEDITKALGPDSPGGGPLVYWYVDGLDEDNHPTTKPMLFVIFNSKTEKCIYYEKHKPWVIENSPVRLTLHESRHF